jgi:hypothetical protein
VESKELDKVDVCFLVVGHTHCSIDQYFSVFSDAIGKADFIPTPDAMRYLIANAHKNPHERPMICRPIEVQIRFILLF